jgi:hypothetical protein
MKPRRVSRVEKLLVSLVEEVTGSKYNGDLSVDAPKTWGTIHRVISGDAPMGVRAPKVKYMSVIGSDEDHTIFGLGGDDKPYVWQDGKWIEHV